MAPALSLRTPRLGVESVSRSLPHQVVFHGFASQTQPDTAPPHLLLPQFPHPSKERPLRTPNRQRQKSPRRFLSRPTSEQAGEADDVLLPKCTPSSPGHPLFHHPFRWGPKQQPPPGFPPSLLRTAGDRPKTHQDPATHFGLSLPWPPPGRRMESTHSPPSPRRGPTSPHLQASPTALRTRWPLLCPANTPGGALPQDLAPRVRSGPEDPLCANRSPTLTYSISPRRWPPAPSAGRAAAGCLPGRSRLRSRAPRPGPRCIPARARRWRPAGARRGLPGV